MHNMDRINARLPEDLEESPIMEVLPGEAGWTYPWEMEVDNERRLWLPARLALGAESHGSASLYVVRREEGYEVDISKAKDQKWEVDSDAYAAEFIEDGYVPVVSLIRSDINKVALPAEEEIAAASEEVIEPVEKGGILRRIGRRALGH